jgi:hypothetical protein
LCILEELRDCKQAGFQEGGVAFLSSVVAALHRQAQA